MRAMRMRRRYLARRKMTPKQITAQIAVDATVLKVDVLAEGLAVAMRWVHTREDYFRVRHLMDTALMPAIEEMDRAELALDRLYKPRRKPRGVTVVKNPIN